MNDILIQKPTCTDNFKVISPGLVGSVGDVNMATRMRTSNAAMFPVMFDVTAARLEKMGSDLQDGDSLTQVNGGGYPASVRDSRWNVKQSRKDDVGDRWQDLRQNDRLVEPIVIGQTQFDFKSMVAQVEQGLATGDRFLPLPGGYEANAVLTRGGLFPSVVQQENIMEQQQQPRDKLGNTLSSLLMAPKPIIQDSTIKQPTPMATPAPTTVKKEGSISMTKPGRVEKAKPKPAGLFASLGLKNALPEALRSRLPGISE